MSGGWVSLSGGWVSSTEILLNGVWTGVGELPNPIGGVRAVSIDNTIILTGRYLKTF